MIVKSISVKIDKIKVMLDLNKEQNENELEYVSIFHFYEQLNK